VRVSRPRRDVDGRAAYLAAGGIPSLVQKDVRDRAARGELPVVVLRDLLIPAHQRGQAAGSCYPRVRPGFAALCPARPQPPPWGSGHGPAQPRAAPGGGSSPAAAANARNAAITGSCRAGGSAPSSRERPMQGHWANNAPYYRCRLPAPFARQNRILAPAQPVTHVPGRAERNAHLTGDLAESRVWPGGKEFARALPAFRPVDGTQLSVTADPGVQLRNSLSCASLDRRYCMTGQTCHQGDRAVGPIRMRCHNPVCHHPGVGQ
jgi:hypothetical protein